MRGKLCFEHHDGSPPLTLTAGSPAGERGVSVLRARFKRSTYSSGVVQQHKIFFQLSPQLRRLECRMAGQTLQHQTHTGSLAICPAGIDSSADIYASIDLLLIAIEPSQLALAAAEDAAPEAQLHERLSGYDHQLFRIARALESEIADGYPIGRCTCAGLPARGAEPESEPHDQPDRKSVASPKPAIARADFDAWRRRL
jgi:AraC family transcriptional regulator